MVQSIKEYVILLPKNSLLPVSGGIGKISYMAKTIKNKIALFSKGALKNVFNTLNKAARLIRAMGPAVAIMPWAKYPISYLK